MQKVNICFVLSSDSSRLQVTNNFSENYELVYKPLISFLYSHPQFKFTFSFTGEQLEWYKKNCPEFLKVLAELSIRKQIEILGGGYYNPVFPLLFPADRVGQIEMLSSEIRRLIGKRPRGLTLCASAWDTSLISGFQSCGMEYAILDSSLIPPSKLLYLPVIAADKGKTLCIIPSYRNLIPDENVSASSYLKSLVANVKKTCKDSPLNSEDDFRIVTVCLRKHVLANLLKKGWVEDFFTEIENNYKDSIELSLPLLCRRTSTTFIQSYIPSGISSDIGTWASVPFTSVQNKEKFPLTIYDLFKTYPRQQALYNRMLYVSMLLNQCHGDKMRKKAAREKLWESQAGDAFICTPNGVIANSKSRQAAYRSLAEAEKLIRDAEEFNESITAFDYNCDGNDEYICQMKQYNACIGLESGSVFEFDVMKNSGNYTDNFSRLEKFDDYTDKYTRGFFVDNLFDNDEFQLFKKQRPTGGGIFSNKKYHQVLFSSNRQEIRLEATGSFSNLKQNVRLKKNYFVTSNGFMVQYILKNESTLPLSGKLTVESNFARSDDKLVYKLEALANGERKELSAEESKNSVVNKVSYVQVVDTQSDIAFIFEPNENASFIYSQISFMRPNEKDEAVVAGKTLSTVFSWDVQLAPNMEMEKTINFTVFVNKKTRKSAKTAART
ncbi:MAG: DUF1926 domain-containing protein [Treponema sp.]|nr:DUF1926 domain-containing protein [Treponema sp.]